MSKMSGHSSLHKVTGRGFVPEVNNPQLAAAQACSVLPFHHCLEDGGS